MDSKYLGLDVGTRRIGVALSTEGGMVLPLETVESRDIQRAAHRIVSLVAEYEACAIVYGWPLDMKGREGRAVESVKRFLGFLEAELQKKSLSLPLHRWDERMSTMAADRLLAPARLSRERRKDAIDQVAATEILRGFLEKEHNHG